MDLEVQIVWQAQPIVDLEVWFSREAQIFPRTTIYK